MEQRTDSHSTPNRAVRVRTRRQPLTPGEIAEKYNQIMALTAAHRARAARARPKHTDAELAALSTEILMREADEITLHEVGDIEPSFDIKRRFEKNADELHCAFSGHLNKVQEAYALALMKAGLEGYSSVTWSTEELLRRVNKELGHGSQIKPHKLYAAMRACEEMGATGHKRRANRPSIRWVFLNWRAPVSN